MGTEDELISRLVKIGVGQDSPKKGERFSDFTLPDLSGRAISLSQLLIRGPIVIKCQSGSLVSLRPAPAWDFFRGSSAPQGLKSASVVSIVPDVRPYAGRIARGVASPFKILLDVRQGYAVSLGLTTWIGEQMTNALKQCDINLPRFQGTDEWLSLIPAAFIVAPDRSILAARVNPNFRDRMALEEAESAMRLY